MILEEMNSMENESAGKVDVLLLIFN